MHQIASTILDRIHTGLNRSAIQSCADWAANYRIMGKPFPGPYSFKHHPWCKDMHNSRTETNIGQKAAQVGYSETVLNWIFYSIDMLGESALYILPTDDDASDFSASRFDPALESSPHLAQLFTDVKNTGHKRAGSANLFVRGSRSRSKLKSIPVAKIVFDELDEMRQENISLALERGSGQDEKQVWKISTPTVEDYGINQYFKESTGEHFFFRCPGCNKHIELGFDNLKITEPEIKNSYLFCLLCGKTLPHEEKPTYLASGKWVKSQDADERGFYINQLYSMVKACHPSVIAKSYLKGLDDVEEEQEFWNSKMGMTHTVEGAKISESLIVQCIKKQAYTKSLKSSGGIITMGVDVGTWLHVEIDEWHMNTDKTLQTDLSSIATPKIIQELKVKDFEDLDILMKRYQVNFCVIDANPEKRKSLEFCKRFDGYSRMCYYGNGQRGNQIKLKLDEPAMTVDRTSWLDLALGRFHQNNVLLPTDISLEYRENIKSIVRVVKKNANGNPVANYVNAKPDHFAHSRCYAEIALILAINIQENENISGVL